MERFSFVWLDSSTNHTQENLVKKRFQDLLKNVIFFENEKQFTEYIEDLFKDDRIVFIINDQLIEVEAFQKIHERSQIVSIYIYFSNQKKCEDWTKKYYKIKGIFIQLNELIEKVLFDYNKQEFINMDESISFNFYDGYSTNELNGGFIHSQLLIDCLIQLKSNQDEKDEFFSFYQKYNKKDKILEGTLDKFLKEYETKSALKWYTTDTGLCRIINEALRNKEIDLLYYLRFFLRDIEQELKTMKYESANPVFRGQHHMVGQYFSDEMNLFFFGNILHSMDKLHDAKKYYERFLKEASEDHHDIAGCYHSLGMIEEENGNYEQSLEHFKKSLEMDEQSLSDTNLSNSDPNIALSYNSIAVVYYKKRDYPEAIEFFNQALTIFKCASGDDCLDVAGCYYNIGSVYQAMKEYSEAHNYYRKAADIRRKHPPENRLDIGQSEYAIGNIHLLIDELDLALEKYYLALEIFRKSCPDQHIDIAIAFESIGLVYEKKHDYQQSLAYFQKAKNTYISISLQEHPTMQNIEDNINRVLSKLTIV
ncbi:hypothetical protein I4U23_011357 [Adineta vaga]|nr:hypothetical protein I4U23_011357 [Adineta vaga]